MLSRAGLTVPKNGPGAGDERNRTVRLGRQICTYTIAEQGTTDEVFAPPYHPYTEALLSAIPIADTSVEKKHIVLEGDIPSALNPPPGCPFQTRCPRKLGRICEEEEPPIRVFGRGHRIACHIAPEDLERMEPVIVLADQEAAD